MMKKWAMSRALRLRGAVRRRGGVDMMITVSNPTEPLVSWSSAVPRLGRKRHVTPVRRCLSPSVCLTPMMTTLGQWASMLGFTEAGGESLLRS